MKGLSEHKKTGRMLCAGKKNRGASANRDRFEGEHDGSSKPNLFKLWSDHRAGQSVEVLPEVEHSTEKYENFIGLNKGAFVFF